MSSRPRFTGKYVHPIDEKNRVVFPAGLRGRLLVDELEQGLCLVRGPEGCLELMTHARWDEKSSEIQTLPRNNVLNRNIHRLVLGSIQIVDIDKQGRLLIPDTLKQMAGIQAQVVFLGVGDEIEVWGKERFEGLESEIVPQMGEMLDARTGGAAPAESAAPAAGAAVGRA